MTLNMVPNGPVDLDGALKLTVDDLIRMMPEIEAKFPNDKMPPNPADVHPLTFAALKDVCDLEAFRNFASGFIQPSPPFDAITLHVRTDVEPWALHPCKCKREKGKQSGYGREAH